MPTNDMMVFTQPRHITQQTNPPIHSLLLLPNHTLPTAVVPELLPATSPAHPFAGVLCTRDSKSIQPRVARVKGLSGNIGMEGLVDNAIIADVWVWRRRLGENERVGLGTEWECCGTSR